MMELKLRKEQNRNGSDGLIMNDVKTETNKIIKSTEKNRHEGRERLKTRHDGNKAVTRGKDGGTKVSEIRNDS